jgi:hypothetical protein
MSNAVTMNSNDLDAPNKVIHGEAGVKDGGDKAVKVTENNGQHYDDGRAAKNSGQTTRTDPKADASAAPHAPKRG